MAWQDRLRDAAYISPSKKRYAFSFEVVSSEIDKKTASFDFVGVDGTYVQDNGHSGRRYPMQCIFWGDNHDQEAATFELALLERGTGRLEHPFYGTFDVVPFGTITRRDDLKSAANQTIIETTFFATIGLIYPSASLDPSQNVQSSIDGLDGASAGQFSTSVSVKTSIERGNLKARFDQFIKITESSLNEASSKVAEVRHGFTDLQNGINEGIDVLIGQPLLLAQQVVNLIKAPSRAAAGIRSRLDGYSNLASSIINSAAGRPQDFLSPILPGRKTKIKNDFFAADLFATNAINGLASSVLNYSFQTKPEALNAAQTILDQYDTVAAWRESCFDFLDEIDVGENYQALQNTAALAAGYLIDLSFNLVPERIIVLDRERTIIDLAAQLYGSVDDKLDFLISSNNLSGSEILELPRGRQIRYYAQ